jgi:hypothetical protein
MSTAALINTGILMGIIHVITSPDHLSALATLCGTNVQLFQRGSRGRREASMQNFFLGVRWGLGHSVGLLFVGGILIALENGSDQEWIGTNVAVSVVLEGFVGLFMLALGTYGIIRANKNNRERVWPTNDLSLSLHSRRGEKNLSSSIRDKSDDGMEDFAGKLGGHGLDDSIVARMEDILETKSRHGSISDDLSQCLSIESSRIADSTSMKSADSFVTVTLQHQRPVAQQSSFQQQEQAPSDVIAVVTMPIIQSSAPSPQQIQRQTPTKPQSTSMSATSLMIKHSQNHLIFNDDRGDPCWVSFEKFIHSCCGSMGRRFFQCNPGHLAVVTGIFHGVAGPGGVLGVLPAVQLQDAWLACIYLVTFCVTSTFVMGGFAAFYGSLSRWLAGGDGNNEGDRVFMVEIGSASLSICVGFVWLALLSLGKLDEVFH